jgi:hypothetical protein
MAPSSRSGRIYCVVVVTGGSLGEFSTERYPGRVHLACLQACLGMAKRLLALCLSTQATATWQSTAGTLAALCQTHAAALPLAKHQLHPPKTLYACRLLPTLASFTGTLVSTWQATAYAFTFETPLHRRRMAL